MDINTRIKFYHLLMNHLPIGFDENFQMIYILNKLRNTDVTILDLWNQFYSLYNLTELKELHMNLNLKRIDFDLPPSFDEVKRLSFPRTLKTKEMSRQMPVSVISEKTKEKPKKFPESNISEKDVFEFDEDDHSEDEFAIKKISKTKNNQKNKSKFR